MEKILILAEKKSLAEKIAKGIGNGRYENRGDHFVARDGSVEAHVYYLFGHILQVNLEKTFGEGYGKFPETLYHRVAQGRGKLYQKIKAELEKAKKGEYREVVCAGDPDREGELLVREVLEANRIPESMCTRMWWNSETPSALKEAFYRRRPLAEYSSLYTAGLCRKYGDLWLGINLSRALQSRSGNRNLSLGRVQTPALKLIVDRHREIQNFKPEPYWIIRALCSKEGRPFTAVYTKRPKEEAEALEVFSNLKQAGALKVAKVEKKLKKQSPPKLPQLSDIQSKIGSRLKLTASQVLSIVQKLYEEGYLSYPRTESNYLAQKDREIVVNYLKQIGKEDLISRIDSPEVKKRIFSDRAVEKAGHHAIVPLKPLPEGKFGYRERAVFEEVEKRLLANLMDDHLFEETTVTLVNPLNEKEVYTAKGRVEVRPGWKAVYRDEQEKEQEEENQHLPAVKEGETVKVEKPLIEKKFTQPPPYYTSPAFIRTLKKLGLGTEATRHTFEEVLIKRGYVKREKGKLIPTDEGIKLIEQIKHLEFTSPEETAKWEKILEEIAFKEKQPEEGKKEFLKGIRALTLKAIEEIEKQDFSYLRKKPSKKMVSYAKLIAEKAGIPFDEEKAGEFSYVKEIIEKYRDKVEEELKKLDTPTEKQVNFLRKIQQEGFKVPEKAFSSKREASKVIDRYIKGLKKRKRKRGKK